MTWSRSPRNGNTIVAWTFWRRDHRRALHSLSRHFTELDDIGYIRTVLQETKRELRDFVDEIDLEAMEQTA